MDISLFVSHLSQRLSLDQVYLKGSRLDPDLQDQYSDTDLVLVTKGPLPEREVILRKINELGDIVGREEFSSQGAILFRLAILIGTEVELVDLQVYSESRWQMEQELLSEPYLPLLDSVALENKTSSSSKPNYSPNPDHVDKVWYLFFLCHKKFMRGDHLIGMHLLMEIVRECLVLLMIERDLDSGTNFHRFGNEEEIPAELDLRRLDYQDHDQVKRFLEKLGQWYDERLHHLSSRQAESDS